MRRSCGLASSQAGIGTRVLHVARLKKGSSRNSGKSSPDFEEKVGVVPEAVGHPFDHLALVVDPFQETGVQPMAAVGHEAWHVGLESFGEAA